VESYPFQLRLAGPADLTAIHYLLSEASAWLRTTKNTDQWKKPWPSRSARDARVRAGVENRATWIAWDGGAPVGTITIAARPNPVVWSRLSSECRLSESAVYAHRLVIARKYAGLELGAELLDWAGLYGMCRYGARWVRVDVWRSNAALHDYYQARGFKPCGECADPRYPSGALFQKPVAAITGPGFPRFADTFCASVAPSVAPGRRHGRATCAALRVDAGPAHRPSADGLETCQLAIRLRFPFPSGCTSPRAQEHLPRSRPGFRLADHSGQPAGHPSRTRQNLMINVWR
jgi:Acetyltransferase (GNAT) family